MSCKWRLMDRFDLLKSPLFMLIENDRIHKAKCLRIWCSWWPPVWKKNYLRIFEKIPDFSDISSFEIVTDLHFFSYDLFIVRFFQFLCTFREFSNQKTWIFEILLWFFCAAEMILAAWKLINGKVRRVLNWRE